MAVFGAMKRTRTFEDANETTKSSMKKMNTLLESVLVNYQRHDSHLYRKIFGLFDFHLLILTKNEALIIWKLRLHLGGPLGADRVARGEKNFERTSAVYLIF